MFPGPPVGTPFNLLGRGQPQTDHSFVVVLTICMALVLSRYFFVKYVRDSKYLVIAHDEINQYLSDPHADLKRQFERLEQTARLKATTNAVMVRCKTRSLAILRRRRG